jgi:hypothetical protein
MFSVGSHISIDSRGSRKGRRRWKVPQASTPPDTDLALEHDSLPLEASGCPALGSSPQHYAVRAMQDTELPPSEAEGRKSPEKPRRYFCTWPGCDSRFRHRFEWERHEEAVHYLPYEWVCCLVQATDSGMENCFVCGKSNAGTQHLVEEHFASCANKPIQERTFYRSDQLRQHMRRHLSSKDNDHLAPTIPQSLVQSYRRDNPASDMGAFHCGFCGKCFSSWETRSAHVFDHLESGACKMAWRPGRLPACSVAHDM